SPPLGSDADDVIRTLPHTPAFAIAHSRRHTAQQLPHEPEHGGEGGAVFTKIRRGAVEIAVCVGDSLSIPSYGVSSKTTPPLLPSVLCFPAHWVVPNKFPEASRIKPDTG